MKSLALFSLVQLVMGVTGLIGLLAQLLTLGHATRFCMNHVCPLGSRFMMWIIGVEVRFHGFESVPDPCIVIGNHTSTLDMFIVTMLPVRNKRTFMARWTRIYPPLALNCYANGTIFTPPQRYPALRVRCFQAAEKRLRAAQDSCFLSVEGIRWTTPKVGPFNKGAFHLSAALGWPILPVYIDIPREINPGIGFKTRRGVVHVYARPPIETHTWKIEDIVRHKEETRALYLDYPAGWRSE
jgi:putative phosphoserine phosphatase/1-acylglycerol-3-phosphate O-acyltransferase